MASLSRRSSKKQRALEILVRLKRLYPDATCSLNYSNPFELLVATILSAQCTDERVNQVTPNLFSKFPDPKSMSMSDREELETLIRSTGFYRNKAKNIQGSAQKITNEFNGQVPQQIDQLLSLPGVARKTANVVLANAYGIIQGVTVDTHVKRLTYLWGLTKHTDPLKIERDLMRLIPQADWERFSIMTIYHGRAVCNARKPLCLNCAIADICPSFSK